MEGYCETCRFWKPSKLREQLAEKLVALGACETFVRWDRPGPPSSEHVYVDQEDPWSPPDLYTGSKFGCIHWQEKQGEGNA